MTSGEALSKWIRRGFDSKEELMEKAPVTLSMGDAGGAYILQAGENTERGVNKTYFHTFYGHVWNNNVVWGGGAMFPRDPGQDVHSGDDQGDRGQAEGSVFARD